MSRTLTLKSLLLSNGCTLIWDKIASKTIPFDLNCVDFLVFDSKNECKYFDELCDELELSSMEKIKFGSTILLYQKSKKRNKPEKQQLFQEPTEEIDIIMSNLNNTSINMNEISDSNKNNNKNNNNCSPSSNNRTLNTPDVEHLLPEKHLSTPERKEITQVLKTLVKFSSISTVLPF